MLASSCVRPCAVLDGVDAGDNRVAQAIAAVVVGHDLHMVLVCLVDNRLQFFERQGGLHFQLTFRREGIGASRIGLDMRRTVLDLCANHGACRFRPAWLVRGESDSVGRDRKPGSDHVTAVDGVANGDVAVAVAVAARVAHRGKARDHAVVRPCGRDQADIQCRLILLRGTLEDVAMSVDKARHHRGLTQIDHPGARGNSDPPLRDRRR